MGHIGQEYFKERMKQGSGHFECKDKSSLKDAHIELRNWSFLGRDRITFTPHIGVPNEIIDTAVAALRL